MRNNNVYTSKSCSGLWCFYEKLVYELNTVNCKVAMEFQFGNQPMQAVVQFLSLIFLVLICCPLNFVDGYHAILHIGGLVMRAFFFFFFFNKKLKIKPVYLWF